MANSGDLTAVQPRVLQYQGMREVRASQQGQMRWHFFHQPIGEATAEEYGPNDPASVTLKAVSDCLFSVGYLEPPMMSVSAALADGIHWSPSVDQPEISATVVDWLRPKDHWFYVAAKVAVTVRSLPSNCVVIATYAFNGPALATPMPGIGEWEHTNKYYQDLADNPP